MTKEQTNSWEDELEKYVRENCSLHILGLLGQNPDDPITSKDFRYLITFISGIASQEKEKWEKEQEPRKCDTCEKQNAIYCSVYCAGY